VCASVLTRLPAFLSPDSILFLLGLLRRLYSVVMYEYGVSMSRPQSRKAIKSKRHTHTHTHKQTHTHSHTHTCTSAACSPSCARTASCVCVCVCVCAASASVSEERTSSLSRVLFSCICLSASRAYFALCETIIQTFILISKYATAFLFV
jgi:hypothetical protein